MKNKPAFATHDPVDYLTDEELVRLFIGEMRADGSDREIQGAEEVARRACARYGLSLAAVGLTEGGTANPRPASPKSDPKKRTSPQPEPLAAG